MTYLSFKALIFRISVLKELNAQRLEDFLTRSSRYLSSSPMTQENWTLAFTMPDSELPVYLQETNIQITTFKLKMNRMEYDNFIFLLIAIHLMALW